MAITWQNVGAPNIGSGSQAMNIGANLVTGGLDTLSKAAGNINDRQIRDTRADLHNTLMDMGMKSTDEKTFLRDALRLSKDSGLTPEQGLAEINSVNDTINKLVAPSAQQKLELDTMTQNQQLLEERGGQQVDALLQDFDNRYPQARNTIAQIDQFQAGGGLGTTWQALSDKFTDGGDRAETMDAINKLITDGKYSDYVASRALNRVGIEEEGVIFDGNLINNKAFKRLLVEEQRKYDEALANSTQRSELENTLRNNLADRVRAGRQSLLDFSKGITDKNRALLSSN